MYSYDISVVVPCLNEEKTIASVCERIFSSLSELSLSYEVILADNGSSDKSIEIATTFPLRVVHVPEKGYGNALRAGFSSAQGNMVFYADADMSYDFAYIGEFVRVQKEGGYDMVTGSRLRGVMEDGAMPWSHRYIGTPALTALINMLYGTRFTDCNCGMRLITKEALKTMGLRSSGMELSAEIFIRAGKCKLATTEIPIDFYKDQRGKRPHLRTIRDGIRNLKCILGMRI